MKAIDFVNRTGVGATNYGSVGGEGQSFTIQADPGDQISLNLRQSDLRGYDRAGSDLLITLADGRVIVIEDYFDAAAGEAPRLFISADGILNEVSFEGDAAGTLYASYGPTETWGKWSASDELIFLDNPTVVADGMVAADEDVSMLGASLLGLGGLGAAGAGSAALVGAGLLGTAGLIGGGGGDGSGGGGGGGVGTGGGTPVAPVLVTPDGTVAIGGGDTPEIVVSGTGEPGSEVTVIIGDETQTTTVDPDGTWTTDFTEEDFPVDGEYTIEVEVVAPDGTQTDITGPDIVIDTTPPLVDVETGTESVGDIVNGEDHLDGTEVTGTVEPGATVVVTVEDTHYDAVVDEAGNWSVVIDDTVLPGGEYATDITIVATDAMGNSTTVTDVIQIDTIPHPLAIDPVGQDNLVNGADADAGFEITGISTPGAVVSVVFGDMTHEVVTDDTGVWSVMVSSGSFAGGEYTATITASTVDAAGNTSNTTSQVEIDTVGAVALDGASVAGDDILNAVEHSDGTTFTGTSQPGSVVSVTVEGTTLDATVAGDGSWSVTFGAGDIPAGTYGTKVVVNATDAAGNTSSTSHSFAVDTELSVSLNGGIGGDGLINAAEAAAGVTLSGTAEAGSSLVVSFKGTEHATTAGADGTWSVSVPAANIPTGVYDATVGVVATDAAGNSATTTGSVHVDTEGAVAFSAIAVEGDDIVNAAERADGITLTGITEPGSTVAVSIGGVTRPATVTSNGSWSVTFSAADLPSGTQSVTATATATDPAGNVTTATDSFAIDTETAVSVATDRVEGDGIINAAERSDGVILTGQAEPGSTVLVQMGTATRPATVLGNGSWSVTFSANEIPSGEREVSVTATATDAAGNSAVATGTVDIDTLVRNFAVTSAPGGADGIVSAAEAAQGLTLSGTTEPGSTVMLTLDGVSRPATVAANGTWTATFLPGDLPSGERTVTLTASSTDAAGNTDTLTQGVVIDTVAGVLTISAAPVEGDDIINLAERSDGVTLTGSSTPGQMVVVTLDGVSRTVQTNAGGIWRATYLAGEIASGTYDAQITATITDSAGNTLTRTDSVRVDTEVVNFAAGSAPIEGDNVVNAAEAANGIVLAGTTEPGGSVTVTLEGVSRTATVDGQGNWTASFTAAEVTAGQYDTTATIATRDVAGNTAGTSVSFHVDTLVEVLTLSDAPITADNVINAAEAANGVTLTGMVEQGSSVQVTIGGQAYTATVAANGSWSVALPPSAIPAGTLDAPVLIAATDAAGNTRSITETITIDTEAPVPVDVESYTRDHNGLRGISIALTEDLVEVGHVVGTGAAARVEDVDFVSFDMVDRGETSLFFTENVPDGSHLVITATDAAGNSSGTYLVVDDTTTSVVDMSAANRLGQFNIETIDLQFAEDSQLTITEAQLLALSSTSDSVVVAGGLDDTVTITGAILTGTSTGDDGQGYNVYALGDGTVLIEDDITNVVI